MSKVVEYLRKQEARKYCHETVEKERGERSPSNVRGDYPAPQQPKNTASETRDASVMGKMILKDDKSQNCTTNAVNEFESEAEGGVVEVIEE